MRRKDIFNLDEFQFRGLHPKISIGTASDRYAGWIGQVYSKERYASKITKRTNKVGGKAFTEGVLPIESLDEYFEHFKVLEIDYTFYRPLLGNDGKPTQTYYALSNYKKYLKENDHLILKVPQSICAQKIRRKGQYVKNEEYLNPEIFINRFYKPTVSLLGPSLIGLIFEQEYQRKQDRTPIKDMAKSLDLFFASIPKDDRYHIELRTETYLAPKIFEVLEKYAVGQVLSHWTWLPPLRKQFAKSNYMFFNSGRRSIVRLMTPIGMRYEAAYEKAHPFDKIVDDMFQREMVEDTVALMQKGIKEGVQMNIVINNRSGGNAPLIGHRIAEQFTHS